MAARRRRRKGSKRRLRLGKLELQPRCKSDVRQVPNLLQGGVAHALIHADKGNSAAALLFATEIESCDIDALASKKSAKCADIAGLVRILGIEKVVREFTFERDSVDL